MYVAPRTPHLFRIPRVLHIPVSHTTQDLIFLWNTTDPLVVNPEIELPQLDISNNYTTDCTIEYSTGNFTCIQIVFNLRRRLGYHLFHTYIPSALIVVMSWIAFWIKPEAIPARVTLGVTSLLTLGKARPLRLYPLLGRRLFTIFAIRMRLCRGCCTRDADKPVIYYNYWPFCRLTDVKPKPNEITRNRGRARGLRCRSKTKWNST